MTMMVDDREAAAVGYLEEPLNIAAFPPRAWFEEVPSWYDPKMGLVQVCMSGPDEGRVAALVAPWNECIMDGKPGCWTAPASLTDYQYAHVGATICEGGDKVRTANIGGKINHADIRWPMQAAIDHYANTATRTMQGSYHDTPEGIMYLGMMVHGSTRLDALTCMASALSGDWRWVENLKGYEMAGSQLVNNPAFRPLPMLSAEFAMTASLGITASLDSNMDEEPPAAVFGNWTFTQAPGTDGGERRSEFVDVGRDIERLGAVLASLEARMEPFTDGEDPLYESAPGATTPALYDYDLDGDVDLDDLIGIAREVFGCERCGGDGCRHCNHTGLREWDPSDAVGYDMTDELPEGMTSHIESDFDDDAAPAIPDEIPLIESLDNA